MSVRPADAPHRRGQRAQAADAKEEMETAVPEGEAAVHLEPEPRLEAGVQYVGPNRLTRRAGVGTVETKHGRIIGHIGRSQRKTR